MDPVRDPVGRGQIDSMQGSTTPFAHFSRRLNNVEKRLSFIRDNLLQSARGVNEQSDQSYEKIAEGADKWVFVPKNPITVSDAKVFYTPVFKLSGFIDKTKTLRNEIMKMKDIKNAVEKLGLNTDHLALDAEEVTGDGQILNRYTVEVEKASGDFEKLMQSPQLNFELRMNLANQYLEGMSTLNRAGYASGDIKPENCLIYQKDASPITLKISDFGKGKKVDDSSTHYTGNLRFAAPEGVLSTKSDAWGSALVIIRTFEEGIPGFSGDSLLGIDEKMRDDPTSKGRRGIEKFIVENKTFLGLDEPTLMDKIFRRLPRQAKLTRLSEEQKQAQSAAVHKYIDELILKLKESKDPSLSDQKLANLSKVLKQMTHSDPKYRLSTTDAFSLFSKFGLND